VKKSGKDKSEAVEKKQPPRRGRLLIVEDSESSRAMIGEHLREESYEYDEAENGAIAVEKARASRFDLILMDIHMPMMDGYEAIRRIRQWEEGHGLARTPIIAFTGSAFDEDVQRALDSGADLHVSKPVRKDDLATAIKNLIHNDAEATSTKKHSA
jgi:CheY-like chemotaxis protein